MVRRILLLSLLVHALLAAEDGSSGVGSGEGSGEACIEPVPRPEPLGGSVGTGGDREPRCHIGCIERVASQEGINLEELVSTTYPAWPMIPDSVLQRNCSTYKMVQNCRESCSLITDVQCQRKCETKSCDSPDPNSCQICNQRHCLTGCDVMLELAQIRSNDTHGVAPPSPVAPLDLTIADGFDENSPHISDAGLYVMNPTNTVPRETDSSLVRHLTMIIVRVGRVGAKKQKYMWMASFEDTLNLTAYACEDVRVQLGAINKYGLASESYTFHSSLTIDVYGESPPTHALHPEVVSISVSGDDRPGFWKHAIVEIHWKRVIKGFELLDHYIVTFKLDGTPEEQPHCTPRLLTHERKKSAEENDVRWEIKAERLGDGPVSDCRYTVKVESVSVNRSMPTYQPQTHHLHISSKDTIPVPLEPVWNQTWDDDTGNFTYKLDWSLPDDANVRRAVGSFEVIIDLVAPDHSGETLFSTVYHTNANSGPDYHYSQQVRYDDKNYRHRITLKSHLGDTSATVFLPAPEIHSYSAEAVPPAQVEGVSWKFEIKRKEVSKSSVTLDIAVVWEELETQVAYYQLRVVRENTNSSDVEPLHELQPTEPKALITGLKVTLLPFQPCLYIQVKGVTQFMAEGQWSEVECLELPLPPTLSPSPQSSTTPTTSTGDALGGASTSGGESSGQVVYIIVSVILLLAVCVAILFVIIFLAYYPSLRNRRQKRRRRNNTVFMTRKSSEKDKYTVGKLDQWEVYSNQVAIQSRLGEGAFGDVYRGLFDGSITEKSSFKKFDSNNSVVVAVKLLRGDATDKDRQIFLKHILQAKKVAQYQHPNLVCLVGCVTEMEPLSLLTEYPEYGDLLTYLRTQRIELCQLRLQMLDYQEEESGQKQLPNIMPQFSSEQSLQAQDLMLFASHVAAGLEHLASIGVVHGDVACRNLFLTADKIVKIADFGVDSISEEEKGVVYMKSELGRLPIRWMAIESIRDGEFSTSSDVWAFGVTLWEIASLGGFPYHDTANSDILATLSAGQRLQQPTNCSEEIYGIMLKCCAAFPGDRPGFSTLHHVFKSLHTTSSNGQYITLEVDPHSPYYLCSPRSSVNIDPPSLPITDDRTPLVDPEKAAAIEVTVIAPHLGSGESFASDGGVSNQHFRTASYSYSDAGALPCIAEEGEDVTDNDEEMTGEEEEERKRDSSNDSTYSHEDNGKLAKLSDKDDSEESLIVAGATAVEFV